MARERLTQRSKQADDPIQMSRDTKNPPVEKYETGTPSSWAEDVYDKHLWEAENKPGGRAETGHPAEVKQSYGPSVKEAAIKQAKALKAKALKCVRIAESLLPRSTEASLEDQGMDLMELSDRAVEATLARLAEEGQNEKIQEMKYEAGDEPATPKKGGKKANGVGTADSLEGANPSGEFGAHPATAKEEDEEEAMEKDEDDVMKEARSLLARAKKLIADAEKSEEDKPFPGAAPAFGKEEDEEEAMEKDEDEKEEEAPAFEADDEEEMSDSEKMANVLVKKAKVLVAAYETEKNKVVAAVIKKEATSLLAQARKMIAGDAVKDDSVPPTLGAETEAKAPVAEKGQDAGKAAALEAKKTLALKHLQAAKKMLAELGMEEGELPPALQENADKMKAKGGDMAAEEAQPLEGETGDVPGTEGAEHPAAQEADEEKEEDEDEFGMDKDDDIDMMSGKSDDDVEALFMSPEMEDAKEAYEKAFGGDDGEEGEIEEAKMASKTASRAAPKKGAKTLKSGLKISSIANNANELEALWDCPPDVSHLFK